MTARFSWNQRNTRGHRPRLQSDWGSFSVTSVEILIGPSALALTLIGFALVFYGCFDDPEYYLLPPLELRLLFLGRIAAGSVRS